MTPRDNKDRHFPLFAHDNLFRRLVSNPREFCVYVKEDEVVADLGCGPGFYTIALAECVGPEGRVYAVDSDEKAIRAVERKAQEFGCHSIETRVSSASDLSFIADKSIDFILANGLLCSMAPRQHEEAVGEMKRILKPTGTAYLSAARGLMSYVGKAEWELILDGFRVIRRGGEGFLPLLDRWAVVSPKQT